MQISINIAQKKKKKKKKKKKEESPTVDMAVIYLCHHLAWLTHRPA